MLRFLRTLPVLVATAIGFCFIVFTILGNTRRSAFLDKIYLFKIDSSNIVAYKQPDARHPNVTAAENIGLGNKYYFYLWGYCEDHQHPKFTYCTDFSSGYYFDPVSILKRRLIRDAIVKLPSGTDSFINKVKISTIVVKSLYGSAIALILLLFIVSLVVSIFGLGDGVSSAVSFIAFTAMLFSLVASGCLTALIMTIKGKIENKAGYLNLVVNYGRMPIIYTWIAAYVIIVAYVVLLIMNQQIKRRRIATEKLY
ncbi:hypothetical protein PORY_002725 [Pneumocystis oryctolagi]|uniref:Uncharacterized protein n=1 Tax=Pneumocystis oryctolagi TaxID=42067 RepID=A0ACB7C8A8_9ASCO|nr:hypothetical protein PORY_002725 [Pneumocystis oryctolagi]